MKEDTKEFKKGDQCYHVPTWKHLVYAELEKSTVMGAGLRMLPLNTGMAEEEHCFRTIEDAAKYWLPRINKKMTDMTTSYLSKVHPIELALEKLHNLAGGKNITKKKDIETAHVKITCDNSGYRAIWKAETKISYAEYEYGEWDSEEGEAGFYLGTAVFPKILPESGAVPAVVITEADYKTLLKEAGRGHETDNKQA